MKLKVHFRMLLVLLLVLGSGWARAEVITLNPDVRAEYVVERGDTLWDIADYYLAHPWQWPQLWQVNPQIANPHLIFPGDVLVLTWVDGQPRLGLRQDSIERRLSPQVRRSALDTAIPPIPLDVIGAFLQGPRLIDRRSWDQAPYILAFADERLLGTIGVPTYARAVNTTEERYWRVLHRGQTVVDPEDGKTLGYEGIPVGELELQDFEDPAQARLVSADREVLRGDRLFLDAAPPLPGSFMPAAPDTDVAGRVAAIYDQYTQAGQFQIIAINRGDEAGLEPGHVLRLQIAGAKVIDPTRAFKPRVQLPPVDAGYVMLFDVGAQLSYGLILESTRGIKRGDLVRTPQI